MRGELGKVIEALSAYVHKIQCNFDVTPKERIFLSALLHYDVINELVN